MVQLTAIMAVEKQAAKSHDKLCWVLLTDLPKSSTKQTIEKVHWYTKRWNIDVFHKVLQSGFTVENAQLATADRLNNYVVLKSVVAWLLLWLTRMHLEIEAAICYVVLDKLVSTLLYRKFNSIIASAYAKTSDGLDSENGWIYCKTIRPAIWCNQHVARLGTISSDDLIIIEIFTGKAKMLTQGASRRMLTICSSECRFFFTSVFLR